MTKLMYRTQALGADTVVNGVVVHGPYRAQYLLFDSSGRQVSVVDVPGEYQSFAQASYAAKVAAEATGATPLPYGG